MASQKVFKEDVYRAANELVAEGRSPSVLNIRAVLGKGGNNTISKFRQEWLDESEHNKTDATEEEIIVPDDVAEFFRHISKKLWKFSFEKAADDFEEIKVAMSDAKLKADDEVRTATTLISEQDAKIEDLESRIQQLQIEKKASDKLAENTQYQLDSANGVNRDLKSDLKEARQEHNASVEEKAKIGADLQVLQAKFDDLTTTLTNKENELSALQDDLTAANTIKDELASEVTEKKRTIESQSNEIDRLIAASDKQKEEYKKQFQKFTESEHINTKLQERLDNAEKRIREMNNQLEKLQRQLVDLAKSEQKQAGER